ncbi:MAG: hypothetical protein WC428_00365 [Candidatus Paceibacterota bacterium]
MNTYKITNLTNTAAKRDFKFNSSLDIDYVDNMIRKTVTVKPGESLYLTVAELPVSVHKLRIKNLISVVEISQRELENVMNASKLKVAAVPVAEVAVVEEVTTEETTRRSNKKKKE